MLILLSPAKTLDFSSKILVNLEYSKPLFLSETSELIKILKDYSVEQIAKLMNISSKLSELNYKRFQEFDNNENLRAAIFAYKGDVYQGIELEKYTKKEFEFANNHLRIISGLYGLLKPLDLIKAYRLEMGTGLPNAKGKNLYCFWQEKVTNALNQEKIDCIINLASEEYSSCVLSTKLLKPIINVCFKESHNNDYKIIGIHAKKARGIMANFIIRNHILNPEELKRFNQNNYRYSTELSSENEYVFIR